jgi:hypothetical protein
MRVLSLTFWLVLGLVVWAAAILALVTQLSGHLSFQIVSATPLA